jgi:hypothetical protein
VVKDIGVIGSKGVGRDVDKAFAVAITDVYLDFICFIRQGDVEELEEREGC